MTYTEFRCYLDFRGNIILRNGNDQFDAALEEYANSRDYKTVERIAATTRAALSTIYKIPLRTLENWSSGATQPPQYVLDLLAYAVIQDKLGKA